ncbi:MAG: hypothetical protein M3416_03815 [Acidobacteriota bacterium]|nr:hypothetical protein [Acidobacteriota bacterium]
MSSSAEAWREWFDRVGSAVSVDVVNATANLVIVECDIYARSAAEESARLAGNEDTLLRAVEAVCHAWNMTPPDKRTGEMQEAINALSGAHQQVMRGGPKGR